jgi:hypothetical protein
MQSYKMCYTCTIGPNPLTTLKVSEQTTTGEEKECWYGDYGRRVNRQDFTNWQPPLVKMSLDDDNDDDDHDVCARAHARVHEHVCVLIPVASWPKALAWATHLLGLWVPILQGAWMSVSCQCCVLSGRDLCARMITYPQKSYRVWCVCLSVIMKPW